MQARPEAGLHPLPCLHRHMCCFTDSPLVHPYNKIPPTSEPFSPPSAVTASVRMWWGLLSSSLGASSASWFFPCPQGATREWPWATEARLKYPERLPPPPPLCFHEKLVSKSQNCLFGLTIALIQQGNVSILSGLVTGGAFLAENR